MMTDYQAKVNGAKEIQVGYNNGTWQLNQADVPWDMIRTGTRQFHVLLEGRSYVAEVLHFDPSAKTCSLRINNRRYEVSLQDKYDVLLHQLGMDKGQGRKANDMKAPMPGLVLRVMAEPGTVLKKGDSVLVLEAMKMENVLKAPGDGVVKAVQVKAGDKVEKGQLLLTLE